MLYRPNTARTRAPKSKAEETPVLSCPFPDDVLVAAGAEVEEAGVCAAGLDTDREVDVTVDAVEAVVEDCVDVRCVDLNNGLEVYFFRKNLYLRCLCLGFCLCGARRGGVSWWQAFSVHCIATAQVVY